MVNWYKGDISVGDRILLCGNYSGGNEGTVEELYKHPHTGADRASIRRDDGCTGDGTIINDYGKGWMIERKDDGSWGASGNSRGILLLNLNWQKIIEEE